MERFRHVPSLLAFSADKMRKVGLVDTPNLFCDAYCLEPGQEQAGHRHVVGDKLYYVLSGRGRISGVMLSAARARATRVMTLGLKGEVSPVHPVSRVAMPPPVIPRTWRRP